VKDSILFFWKPTAAGVSLVALSYPLSCLITKPEHGVYVGKS
jgi:hypothetical protein